MLKKLGIGTITLGVVVFAFGFWMLEASENLWKYRYSSGMRTLIEFAPWMLMLIGAFSVIGGIFYIVQDRKPVTKVMGKVIEKNGNSVVFELDDGSRKTLVTTGKVHLVVGDYGKIEYKGSFVTNFSK